MVQSAGSSLGVTPRRRSIAGEVAEGAAFALRKIHSVAARPNPSLGAISHVG
jgi:hypothetical protein